MLRNLDHQLWKFIKDHNISDKKIILAVSGGLDSVALLRSFSKVINKSQLIVCYVHHGCKSEMKSYRDQALSFVQKLSEQNNLEFVSLSFDESIAENNGISIESEEFFREGRYKLLRKLKEERAFDYLALGHHADDLLETRIIRLIRGTGAQGLLAMSGVSEDLCRPFLRASKQELSEYLSQEDLKYLEDPSNSNPHYLRNWIRNEWLPLLEAKQAGASVSMARSLELIASAVQSSERVLESDEYVNLQGISRSYFLTLDSLSQSRCLARYLYLLEIRDFSHSHIEEIKKRLANSQKVLSFRVAGLTWDINAEQIKIHR